jgi:hypothetical protein
MAIMILCSMLQEKFQDMSTEDILKRVAALEFDRLSKVYMKL